MPTPSNNESTVPSHSSCPPELEDERSGWRGPEMERTRDELNPIAPEVLQQPTPPPTISQGPIADEHIHNQSKRLPVNDEIMAADMLSPVSAEGDKQEESELLALSSTSTNSPSLGYDFSNIRLIPSSPSSFLRAGSKFHGTQQSERQVYEVQVEIKHVDMRESFLCGYLRIQGLTDDHPTLTTYFEGEIIGSKYTFLTPHSDWGSTDKVDIQHWQQFDAFKPYTKQAKKGHHIPGLMQRENIFMRWKEHFLVPDHRIRTISGASFEGFYYICFNQTEGRVSGIYFHAKSEKFQKLELKRVEDRGCFAAMEFR